MYQAHTHQNGTDYNISIISSSIVVSSKCWRHFVLLSFDFGFLFTVFELTFDHLFKIAEVKEAGGQPLR